MITQDNVLLGLDVYKAGHMEQYKPGTNKVYSYYCHRSDRYFDQHVFFGLQYLLKNYMAKKLTPEMGEEYLNVVQTITGNVNQEVKDKIKGLCDLGYIPLEIKALPEGSVTTKGVPCFTLTNTVDGFGWAVGFFESLLLKTWYPSVVATTSRKYRLLVEKLFEESVDHNAHGLIPFMVHDFGYRSDSSEESAAISGVAHLLSFCGSDTIPALPLAVRDYGAKPNESMIMACVPASEHSVACSFGLDGEFEYFENMLNLYPEGIVSLVSDQYDVYRVFAEYTLKLKDRILARNGKCVFRPDSGSQEIVICGYEPEDIEYSSVDLLTKIDSESFKMKLLNSLNEYSNAVRTTDNKYFSLDFQEITSERELKGCMRLLDKVFGTTTNSKGYKVLNPKVGLIYGDGMYYDKYERIQRRLMRMGYSAENLIIGVGGILRSHSRDTLGAALKCTHIEVNGEPKEIFKDPVTDKEKKSAKGLLKVDLREGEYFMYDQVSVKEEQEGELQPVFRDGKLLKQWTFEEIRERLETSLTK